VLQGRSEFLKDFVEYIKTLATQKEKIYREEERTEEDEAL
jgi:hypothetical protein